MTKIDTNETEINETKNTTEETVSNPFFDEREFCEKEIWPLVQEIHKKCVEHKIPMVCSICRLNNKEYNMTSAAVSMPGARTPGSPGRRP
jgi:hypothetical protein